MKREGIGQGIALGCLLAGIVLLLPGTGQAKVQGQCANCHTMHNSQGGKSMGYQNEPYARELLLRGDCISCHTGTNDGSNVVPYVYSTTAPTYGADGTTGNTLAGGNFYWVANGDDTAGHNVGTDGFISQDATLGTVPPGGTDMGTPVGCAGTTGCHGDPTINGTYPSIKGAHHGDDSVIDGSTVAKSYRFLKGVLGNEDSDWEYQPTATAHNQYYGIDRADDTTNDGSTISGLCARCHPDFHHRGGTNQDPNAGVSYYTGQFSSPWMRHPTDFDMGNTAAGSEYRGYGGTGNAYVVAAPVASSDVSTVLSSVTFNDDTIVTCVSCHRAHGTKYPDLLRWDYSQITAGGGGSGGCFECHTTKM